MNNFQGKVESHGKESDLPEELVQPSSISHTELDDLIQEIALEILQAHNFQISLNVEEDTPRMHLFDTGADLCFHLDPLDGTYAYTRMRSDYAIGAGISQNTDFIASAIYIPAKDILYFADRQGTFSKTNGMGKNLEFDRKTSFPKKFVQKRCEDYLPVIEKMDLVPYDSMSAHYTMMALVEGDISLQLYHKATAHDFGIPSVILSAVGGVVCDESGKEISFNDRFDRVDYFFAFASPEIKAQFFNQLHS